jgi:phosphatidate cytidylyltransferase
MKQFLQRLAFGSFASLFALLLIWFSPEPTFRPIFALTIALLISLAVSEFFLLARQINYQPPGKIGLAGCFLYALSVYLSTQYSELMLVPYFILFVTLIGAFLYFFKTGTHPLVNLSITSFAFIYIAIPLSTWFNIAYFFDNSSIQEGRWWLFYLLAVTKLTDVGAYIIGSTLGRHKMTPYISPGKSWEGAMGGLIFGVSASLAFYFLIPYIPIHLSLVQSLGLGLLLSLLGQFGDLAESLIKRDVGVKNSSHIPGLGGILDMLDSLIFASPILYLFLKTQNG